MPRPAALLLVALLLGAACRSEPEAPAVDRPGTTAPDSADVSGVPPAPTPSTADRTPETDPWLLEGIPPFEDLVAMREGDWLVVLGSFGDVKPPARGSVRRSAVPAVAALQQRAWNAGLVPFVLASSSLPAFEPGRTVVVLGPFPKTQAEHVRAGLRDAVPDVYLKSGW